MSVAGLEVSVDGDVLRLAGRLDFGNAAAAYRHYRREPGRWHCTH